MLKLCKAVAKIRMLKKSNRFGAVMIVIYFKKAIANFYYEFLLPLTFESWVRK